MRWVQLAAIFALAGGTVLAQLTPEEAKQRLEERQKARQAEREKPVTIQQGQLDDLMAEVARLKTENAMLKQQLASVTTRPVAQPAPPKFAAHKKPTEIEIGMTRQDLIDFVTAHPDKYSFEGVSVHESNRHGSHTTITRQEVTQNGDGPPQTIEHKTEIVHSQSGPQRRELVRINILEPQQVPAGRHRDVLGNWVQDTRTEIRRVGWIWATVEDDIVTALDVHAH